LFTAALLIFGERFERKATLPSLAPKRKATR
jgi:hypothetical protein